MAVRTATDRTSLAGQSADLALVVNKLGVLCRLHQCRKHPIGGCAIAVVALSFNMKVFLLVAPLSEPSYLNSCSCLLSDMEKNKTN